MSAERINSADNVMRAVFDELDHPIALYNDEMSLVAASPRGGLLGAQLGQLKKIDVDGQILWIAEQSQILRVDQAPKNDRLSCIYGIEKLLSVALQINQKLTVYLLSLDSVERVSAFLGRSHGKLLVDAILQRISAGLKRQESLFLIEPYHLVIVSLGGSKNEEITATVERISALMAEPFNIADREMLTSFSLGIAIGPDHGDGGELLLDRSAAAAQIASAGGRNRAEIFTQRLVEEIADNFALASQLSGGIIKDELFLFYQPKILHVAGQQTLCGMECLVRWRHPILGMVPPSRFIPVAEESGLMLRIGDWILESACRQLRQWLDAGLNPVPVAVNVSGVQLSRGTLASQVEALLLAYQLPPSLLQFEVTESVLLGDLQYCKSILLRLRALGVSIALDDFGTGYSSLSYLRELPVDTLKIDRSFVIDLAKDPAAGAILQSIVTMSRALGLSIVAEGVETQDQLLALSDLGCDVFQGYLFARPGPAADMARLFT